ncbi:unnamed protein product [Brassicogethes aeneus]|uniref:Uncharacterized protein n=1 Tax=Brassicogethes aeneus TaxID=1431903 RepID=A0A9P0BDR9_BRAAE|nr:unnamed protein product [Brassicogethes aeneus]
MEEICRTCLRTHDYLLDLYKNQELIFKIESIVSIEILQDPFFPSKICKKCVININNFFNFKEVLINSFKELNDRYEAHQKTKAREKEVKEENKTNIIKAEPILMPDYTISSEDFKQENSAILDHMDYSASSPENTEIEHKKKKSFDCNECQRTFISKYKYQTHIRGHTSKGVCNICGMVVRSDNLRRHIQLHSEEPIECDICSKMFKNSESLRSHKRIHLGIIFTCEICGKCFKVKTEYSRHVKTHTDPEIGKAMCSICGKKVKDMRKHKLSHTGERPYKCEVCTKGFTSPYALKIHLRQHTNEKPFICEYCPMAFPQKVSLVTHIKSKHTKLVE